MPRKPKQVKAEQVNRWRANNYAHHFECRKYVQNLPLDIREKYLLVVRSLRPPSLTVYGSTAYLKEEVDLLIHMAIRAGLEAWYLNPWYHSEEGWQDFQGKWQALPELIHNPLWISQEQLEVCTQDEPIHAEMQAIQHV